MTHRVVPRWLPAFKKNLLRPFARVNPYSGVDKAPAGPKARRAPCIKNTPNLHYSKIFICYFELDSILVTGRHYSERSGSNITNICYTCRGASDYCDSEGEGRPMAYVTADGRELGINSHVYRVSD